MTFCSNCGYQYETDSVFCVRCGVLVKETVEKAVVVTQNVKTDGFHISSLEVSESDFRLFVGDKYDSYYLKKWQALDTRNKKSVWCNTGNIKTYNWVAYLVPFLWLGYRKMYEKVFIGLVVYATLFFVTELYAPVLSYRVVGLIPFFVVGYYANEWYRNFATKKITEIYRIGFSPEKRAIKIQEAGGVSVFGVIGTLFFMLLCMYLEDLFIERLQNTDASHSEVIVDSAKNASVDNQERLKTLHIGKKFSPDEEVYTYSPDLTIEGTLVVADGINTHDETISFPAIKLKNAATFQSENSTSADDTYRHVDVIALVLQNDKAKKVFESLKGHSVQITGEVFPRETTLQITEVLVVPATINNISLSDDTQTSAYNDNLQSTSTNVLDAGNTTLDFKPSFDCKKSKKIPEKLICSNADLSALDVELNKVHNEKKATTLDLNSFNENGREWREGQRDKCLDVDCLKSAYQNRIKQLSTLK